MEMKVVELKAELDARGLDKSGVKAVLIDRLTNAVKENGGAARQSESEIHQAAQEMTSLESELLELDNPPDDEEMEKYDSSSVETINEDPESEFTKESDVKESNEDSSTTIDEMVIPQNLKVISDELTELDTGSKPKETQTEVESNKPESQLEEPPPEDSKAREDEREEEMTKDDVQPDNTPMEMASVEEESKGDESSVEANTKESTMEAKIIIASQNIMSDEEEDHDALSLTVLEEERMEFDSANLLIRVENDEISKPEAKESMKSNETGNESKDLEKSLEKPVDKNEKDTSKQAEEKIEKKKDDTGSQSKNGSSKISSSSSNELLVRPRILVTGLSKATRAAQLKEVFTQYAKVATVKVLENNEGSKLSRFAHLSLYSEADVKKCIEMLQNFELHGSTIKLQKLESNTSEENIKVAPKKLSEERRTESRRSEGERRRSSPSRHHHQDGRAHRSHSSHSQPTLTFEQIKTLRDRGLEKEEADRERRRNQEKANLIASIRFEERGKIKKEFAVLQGEWDRLRSEKDEVRKRQSINEEKLRCDRTLFERDKIKFLKEEAKLDLESRALASKWKGLDEKKRDLDMEWKMIQSERRKLEADWEKLDVEKKKAEATRREIDEDRRKLVVAKLEFEKNMKRLDELNAEIKGRINKRPLSPSSSPDAKRRAEARVEHRLQASIPPARAPAARPPILREEDFVRRPPALPIYRESARSPPREQPRKTSYMEKELPPRGERRDFWPPQHSGTVENIPRNSEPVDRNRNPRYPPASTVPGRSNTSSEGDGWTRRVSSGSGVEAAKYRDQPQVNYEREFRPQTMVRYGGESGVPPPAAPSGNRWGTTGGDAIMGGRHPEGLPIPPQQRFSAFQRAEPGKPGARW